MLKILKNAPLLRPSQAALYLGGLSVGTLAVWRSISRGPRFIKIGRRVFYHVEDLNDYVAARKIETRDTADILY